MSTEPAPLLTAEMAGMFTMLDPSCKNGAQVWAARDAIASGRVACYDTETHTAVQKMTEEQAREKFEAWIKAEESKGVHHGFESVYLAALRDAGVIKP